MATARIVDMYQEMENRCLAAEARVAKAKILLARADTHEFKGTTAENGDAHALVRQARAVLEGKR